MSLEVLLISLQLHVFGQLVFDGQKIVNKVSKRYHRSFTFARKIYTNELIGKIYRNIRKYRKLRYGLANILENVLFNFKWRKSYI